MWAQTLSSFSQEVSGHLRWPGPIGEARTSAADLADKVRSSRSMSSDEEDGQQVRNGEGYHAEGKSE